MSKYSFQTRCGKVTLWTEKNILFACFEGNINESMIHFFSRTMEQCRDEIAVPAWGYVSYSEKAIAATPQAYDLLVNVAKRCLQLGCVSAGYVLNSAIAKRQMEKLRKEIGMPEPIEQVLFVDLDTAVEYVNQNLSFHYNAN
ncbi:MULTISPECIES: hypothetical protein [Pseudoalteromonas]|uniref:Uncharacterized protein n=1 Tax=Pseudoalteromonas peptidolytica F12-50-A1 TaxID=1315280 RepID=A0A8I0MZG5_9GAMM|nr:MULTISPECIES: hypothetical protein [Pseudoalteromonas]MBE0348726.1 hypothetical protein [Pseudoalteromonas peptidolytica F12-50-A1]NLR15110.1 hypothetical protein [Pseudoalteromonas peptidolytica]RRS07830.1 hypothetical protein EAG18_14790 [Pseudoalteromonas sp. J010]RXE95968.1 hypothetical protein D9603_19420 [Pseudoalteromonas sp. PS5]USD30664.1 hypothetical protein J8Z24_16920 [Pseudoalteromonas sp. SCSIO 43201]